MDEVTLWTFAGRRPLVVGHVSHGELKMSFERKRHRSDSNSELAIADGETTDSKGRTMKRPFNGLEIYRNHRKEETTMHGHGPRESGARPFFTVYSIWFEGYLVAIAEKRSIAGERARALRSSIPVGTRGELKDDRGKLMKVCKHLSGPETNVSHLSTSELREMYEGREDRRKMYGADMEPAEIATLAAEKGLIDSAEEVLDG